jgi:hypothetical protein
MFDPHNNYDPQTPGKLKDGVAMKSRCNLIAHLVKAMWDGEYPDRPYEIVTLGALHVDGTFSITMHLQKRGFNHDDGVNEVKHFTKLANRAMWFVRILEPTVESEKIKPAPEDTAVEVYFMEVPANSFDEEKRQHMYDHAVCDSNRTFAARYLPEAAGKIYQFFDSRYDEYVEQEKALEVT